jgi:hypothetical protein
MVNDSIDIMDASIINIGIEFDLIAKQDVSPSTVFNIAKNRLFEEMTKIHPEIGEPFQVTDIFRHLKDVQEVLDVVDIKVVNKIGPNYSGFSYSIDQNISPEGRVLFVPHNCIWEIKNSSDITGTVR